MEEIEVVRIMSKLACGLRAGKRAPVALFSHSTGHCETLPSGNPGGGGSQARTGNGLESSGFSPTRNAEFHEPGALDSSTRQVVLYLPNALLRWVTAS